MTFEELNEMAVEIHALALEKGWYDREISRGEAYALIHSEISEAVEEARKGNDPIYWGESGKPEGEAIELADVVIRILDYMGSRGYAFSEEVFTTTITSDILGNYANLHHIVSETYWSDRYRTELNDVGRLYQAIVMCERICKSILHTKLWKAVSIKHEYNKTRPHRHGGKKY
jgi:hypothetical protein